MGCMSCLLFSSFRRVVLLLEEVLQHRFQFIIECLGWGEAIGRIPLVIDNEGRKVPSNVLCSVYAWKLVLEKAVQLCLVSAPLTCPFVNQIELLVRSVLASKFKNLFVSSLLNTHYQQHRSSRQKKLHHLLVPGQRTDCKGKQGFRILANCTRHEA